MIRLLPRSILFPYTTLFRSRPDAGAFRAVHPLAALHAGRASPDVLPGDRKSTRLNSSHLGISYAVFCLKKKKLKQLTKYTKPRSEQLRESNLQDERVQHRRC